MIPVCADNSFVAVTGKAATLWASWRNTPTPGRRFSNISSHRSSRCDCTSRTYVMQAYPSRRACIGALCVAELMLDSGSAHAGFLENLVKASQTDDITPLEATVRLLDGVSILKSIQTLADSKADSELRFKSRAVLPGYAKYLRDVGPAVNVILGGNYNAQLSSRYGGTGEDSSKAEALLERIGATITLSGRTVSPEALEPGSKVASSASESLKAFIATLPEDLVDEAKQFRVDRAERAKRVP